VGNLEWCYCRRAVLGSNEPFLAGVIADAHPLAGVDVNPLNGVIATARPLADVIANTLLLR
jgi:hypothetical protein